MTTHDDAVAHGMRNLSASLSKEWTMKTKTHLKAGAPEPTSLNFNGRGIDLNDDQKIDTVC
jgi:hypothetical protein